MNTVHSFRPKLKVLALLLLLSSFWCLFISPFSPLYIESVKGDVSWWYMCGKAWAEGMTPYVDFADSKGPLLWGFFRLGYSMSPGTYAGLFWLEIPLTCACLCALYRMASLYLPSRSWRVVAVVVVGLFMFSRTWYTHMRAETLCLPFLIYSVHVALEAARGRLPHCRRAAFFLGFGCAWAFLVKYNLAVLVGAALPFLLFAAWKRSSPAAVAGVIASFLAGLFVLLLPFACWAWYEGWLMPCIHEYLVNTAGTICSLHSHGIIEGIVQKCILVVPRCCTAYLLLCIIGAVALAKEKAEPLLFRLSPLLLLLFYVLLIYPSMQEWTYYTMVIIPFCLLPVCCVLRFFRGIRLSRLSLGGILAALALFPVCAQDVSIKPSFFYFQRGGRNFMFREAVAQEIAVPKIMCLGHESAFGITAGSLPACRYWSLQVGASDEMVQERYEAIRAGVPDFVEGQMSSQIICYNGDYRSIPDGMDGEMGQALKAGGYHEIYRNFATGEVVYGKKDAIPRDGYERRKLRDILLKRRLNTDEHVKRK